MITALDMEAMVNTVKGWLENPIKFARSHGVQVTPAMEMDDPESQVHILIVEGFLLYNYKWETFNFRWPELHEWKRLDSGNIG